MKPSPHPPRTLTESPDCFDSKFCLSRRLGGLIVLVLGVDKAPFLAKLKRQIDGHCNALPSYRQGGVPC